MKVSRFIINSDYATLKMDAGASFTLTIPNYVSVPKNSGVVTYTATKKIGTRPRAGFRCVTTSSILSYATTATNFLIPCRETLPGIYTEESAIPVAIYKTSSNYRAVIQFPDYYVDPGDEPYLPDHMEYSGMGQTLTFNIQALIDPFRAEIT